MGGVAQLLEEARNRGLSVAADGTSLIIEGRKKGNKELWTRLASHKPAILAALNGTPSEEEIAGIPKADHNKWPDSIDAAAYYGLAGDIIRTIEPHSESDAVALLVQLLAAFGNMIGRSAYFRAEADRHYGNLFVTLVGVTSKGRKGSSWGQIGRIIEMVDSDWRAQNVVNGLSTGEGLIWAVRDPIVKQEAIRKGGKRTGEIVGYQEVVVDEGVDDKRLFVLESEFAAVLKVGGRKDNTLTATVRQAWDSGRLRTMSKSSPAVATDAHISIVGHITRDELRCLICATDMANGLANRFLWCCVRRSKALPEGGRLRDEVLEPLADRLGAAADCASRQELVVRNEAARAIWANIYADLSGGRAGLLGAVTSRAESQVMRMALLYAMLDQASHIDEQHLMAALAVWRYVEQSAKYIFGASLGDPLADKILAELRKQLPGGLTRTEISALLSRNTSAAELTVSLDLLEESGLARCETIATGGRDAETWFCTL